LYGSGILLARSVSLAFWGIAMLVVMALCSGVLLQTTQLSSSQADTIRKNSIQRAGSLHRSTRNPNHRLNHPGNATSNNSASFHNPSQTLNFHSDGIRRSGGSLQSSASCISNGQSAHGLGTVCFYNCHGHRRSLQITSTENCPHSAPESAF
jgi:hypothetical protein